MYIESDHQKSVRRSTEKKFASEKVFRPSFWSGYRLKPSRIEFWTEKDDRMHDRLLFELTGQGHWNASKLYP